MAGLALPREAGEGFWLNDDVRVTVLGVDRGRVKIRIEAPREIRILRTELIPDGMLPSELPPPPKRDAVPVSQRISEAVAALRTQAPA